MTPLPPQLEILATPSMLIGDRSVRDGSAGWHEHIYAATGRPTLKVPLAGAEEIDAAVTSAREGFDKWQRIPLLERRAALLRLAHAVRENAAVLSTTQTIESSVPRRYADSMPEAAAQHIEHNASWIDKIGGSVLSTWPTPALDYTNRQPYGVVAMIVTWNAALPSLGQLLGAALAAGNAVIVKASELAPFTAFRLAQLATECGLPPGLINVLCGTASAGAALVRHPGVDKIHFTGSTQTARLVLQGAAANVTPICLELGGKSALLIFEDADVPAAVEHALSGAVLLSGQGCTNPTRVLVHASIYEQVIRLARGYARRLSIGDPQLTTTVMGPVIDAAACERILQTISLATTSGQAELLFGGTRLAGPLADGYFIAPTLFGNAAPTSPLMSEEIFGPVIGFAPFENERDAVGLANATRYGLAAYVHTKDVRRAHRVASALQAGNVWINGFEAAAPTVPFGGVKSSGYGRLGGLDGILEFTYMKNTWLRL
jgi:acyl-CoA reductase-like NAD-dependent aldehyde dehydrogenase